MNKNREYSLMEKFKKKAKEKLGIKGLSVEQASYSDNSITELMKLENEAVHDIWNKYEELLKAQNNHPVYQMDSSNIPLSYITPGVVSYQDNYTILSGNSIIYGSTPSEFIVDEVAEQPKPEYKAVCDWDEIKSTPK